MALAKERGAKRTLPLAVSIAAHSRCMESAAQEFSAAVEQTRVRVPTVAVISNVTAQPLQTADDIRKEMVAQLTASVQWVRSIEYMVAQGITHFVEVGPKDVLAGLNRRINREAHAVSIGDVASLRAFAASQ
jgi:[acyl-carrier-protein] S-malonyltransferase